MPVELSVDVVDLTVFEVDAEPDDGGLTLWCNACPTYVEPLRPGRDVRSVSLQRLVRAASDHAAAARHGSSTTSSGRGR